MGFLSSIQKVGPAHITTALPVIKEDVETDRESETDVNTDGLPWWWDAVWKLDIMKTGEPGEEIIFGDSANVLRTNIEQIYGDVSFRKGCIVG